MIASVVDVEASKMAGRQVAGAARHICVKHGVQGHLDQLRQDYAELPALLQQYAERFPNARCLKLKCTG